MKAPMYRKLHNNAYWLSLEWMELKSLQGLLAITMQHYIGYFVKRKDHKEIFNESEAKSKKKGKPLLFRS